MFDCILPIFCDKLESLLVCWNSFEKRPQNSDNVHAMTQCMTQLLVSSTSHSQSISLKTHQYHNAIVPCFVTHIEDTRIYSFVVEHFQKFRKQCKIIQSDTKKRELLKIPTKIEEIQEKKNIDRNWTITTCLLRDSNPNYQCLKITSCRWRPPPRMHSFMATTHFKSSRSFVSPCVCCMLCRMRRSRILHIMQERELLKCVVAVKECIRGGGRHLQDVVFKHW